MEEQARKDHHNGAKATRDRGMKYFNKVGITEEGRQIPRWAANKDLLNTIIKAQND